MAICKMTVENIDAIGAKKAQEIVQKASEYEADMTLRYENKEVDLKSILGIMSLAVLEGAKIEIEAKGPDANEAIEALKQMMN